MLYVCVSFDYELFLGGNNVSEEEVLLRPTEKLSKMLQDLGVSATFFADVCCPKAYRRLGKNEFAEAFDAQVRLLTRQGHDVQLHIHPHWETVSCVGSDTVFSRDRYRIHNWTDEAGRLIPAQALIRDGVDYLKKCILPENPDYRCVAFRAGGYCLQPEKQLAQILFEEGIRIDSSVCRGMAYNGDGMFYDYRVNPRKDNIYISAQYGLEDNRTEPTDNALLEVPVASYRTFPYRPMASKMNKPMASVSGRGKFMPLSKAPNRKKRGLLARLKQMLCASNMVTFDSYSADAMIFMLKRIAKEYGKKDTYIAAIAHPKLQSDEHIENMKKTIVELQKTDNIRFVSMRQMADQLGL